MTLEEFTKIIVCYGAQSDRWPAAVRDAAIDLTATSTEAQNLLAEYVQLEALLDQQQVPDFPNLESRILSQTLPARNHALIDRLINWLLPATSVRLLWRPVLAASLPLFFGIVVGTFFSFGVDVEAIETAEYWEDELYMLSLNDYSEAP